MHPNGGAYSSNIKRWSCQNWPIEEVWHLVCASDFLQPEGIKYRSSQRDVNSGSKDNQQRVPSKRKVNMSSKHWKCRIFNWFQNDVFHLHTNTQIYIYMYIYFIHTQKPFCRGLIVRTHPFSGNQEKPLRFTHVPIFHHVSCASSETDLTIKNKVQRIQPTQLPIHSWKLTWNTIMKVWKMIFLPFQLGTFEVNHVSLPGCIQPIQHLHGNDGLQKTCAVLRARAALEANHCLPPEIVGRDTWISGGHVFGWFSSKPKFIQWSFLVPFIGGRYHIIPHLAVYTTYIPLIYCLLGDYISPTTY